MKKMKFVKMVLCLLILVGFTPFKYTIVISPSFFKTGNIGADVTNPSVNVGQLQDNAYTYTGADIVVYDYSINIDDYVTIVVIDDGLTELEWKALEQNPEANVDIVGFLTKDSEDDIQYITNPTDQLLDDQEEHEHGFAVVSMIAAVAREAKVIFVDLKYDDEPIGFEYDDTDIWTWIDNNQASKDIDIVSCSYFVRDDYTEGTSLHQTWNSLTSKGVILLSSSGNYFSYNNSIGEVAFPFHSYYSEWYSVGSIDHETRWGGSVKGQKSYISSWYDASTEGNHIVNWLEPGNGVPVLEDAYLDRDLQIARGTWRYADGTSFSVPYLAAIVALIITGYHNGIGSSTDPSLQKVIDILQYASSRSTFDQQMGYGYVDTYIAYGKAYTEGCLAA
ncbi:MAG: S8/S53 family peptidase [Candidatus Heimdallarchaeaceae archaeon]